MPNMGVFSNIALIVSLLTSAATCQSASVKGTILVLANDESAGYSAFSGLEAYGIPYTFQTVPQEGFELPTLNSSATQGNYGGFILMNELSYDYGGGAYRSAISNDQFQQIYQYQKDFKVRMVRLGAYPQPNFGSTPVDGGCCGQDVEQLVSFTNITGFPTAGIKANAAMSTKNMWHYPARITDPSMAWEVAKYGPSGEYSSDSTAMLINQIDGREQMVSFGSWATEWSATSNFLQHAFIHWMTRGLFAGARKVYLSTQVDDVHLTTGLYLPQDSEYRISTDDVAAHVPWMRSVNSRMPAGSNFMVELGHNGNGDIINATLTNTRFCNPDDAIYYEEQSVPPLEFQKPLGTGENIWPTSPSNYAWSVFCARIDRLANWFAFSWNRDAFMHLSHTFSHMNLNNATYSDASKEITFNQAWLKQIGISNGRFSPMGLIPPAITGLHNGDVIRAWMNNGITRVVGDNSRPVLMNQENKHWPLISTVESNGYAGLTIVPRFSTAMYYNCDMPECTSQEWVNTSGGWGDFDDLVEFEKTTTSRHLLGLRQDPYMFHQANMRAADMPSYTVGSQTGRFSLLQIWVETVIQEMSRLTTWPMQTLKHDDIAQKFIDRMARDQCAPSLSYQLSSDRSSITSVTVTSSGNSCKVPIPVTFPGSTPRTSGRATSDKVGSEPLIMWTTMSGSPVSYSLSSPVRV